jgi:hypothetical protein
LDTPDPKFNYFYTIGAISFWFDGIRFIISGLPNEFCNYWFGSRRFYKRDIAVACMFRANWLLSDNYFVI